MSVIDIGDYNKRRCKEGMMDSYMSYAYYQESPPDFHLWVLIGMIASALGRNDGEPSERHYLMYLPWDRRCHLKL
jgi:hypothetical protein